MAGEIPASAFQSYDPSAASSIVAGPFALYTVRVNSVLPTQLNLGYNEVGKKVAAYDLLWPSLPALTANLLTSIEPVVIGPGGKLYLTNGHHTFSSLQQSVYGAANPTVYVNVIANYSNLTDEQFWAQMQARNFLLPLDNGVVQPVNPQTGSPIQSSLSAMTNDPYRGLEYSILKNKSSKLFPTTANITGAVGSSIPGLDKTNAYYSDFIWANAYRNANNGLGLPYLSPGDVALATQWNLNGANVTKLQAGGANVTVAQLPGYILAAPLTISSVIDTNTVNNGVLDGNGTFTGLRGMNLGSVTIGTPASTTGFILQLGADRGGTVTLSSNNTYAGGTTILAGTLIIGSDANLGAASPTITDPSVIRTADDVRAANGIVFNSLSEGGGTLQINNSMVLNRPIAVGGEIANINVSGTNTVTLTGPIISLDVQAGGYSDLTLNGGKSSSVILDSAANNPLFYGNWIISSGILVASNDSALGNTTGDRWTIGRIDLDGGTFKAGAAFTSVRDVIVTGKSTFDTNGVATSFGALFDTQRNLSFVNSNTGTGATGAGAVTFDSFKVGSVAELTVDKGAGTSTSVTFTNGIIRDGNATLILNGASGTLGGTEKIFSSGASTAVPNGIVSPWIITDAGSSANNAYDFATYGANGYTAYTASSTNLNPAAGGTIVKTADKAGTVSLTANRAYSALNLSRGATINGSFKMTIGDGTNPAGLILNGTNGNPLTLNNSEIAFGASEGIIYVGGSQTSAVANKVNAAISGSGGLTMSGSGMLTLGKAATETGQITVNSGTLNLAAVDALSGSTSGVLLQNTKNVATANLAFNQTQTLAALNSTGSNSTVVIDSTGTNGGSVTTKLIIGGTNLDSTLSSTIFQGVATVDMTKLPVDGSGKLTPSGTAVAGIITKTGTGMLDLSGMKKETLALVSGSTIEVQGGTLRMSAGAFVGTNDITLRNNSELQFAESGGSVMSGNITGAGTMHLIGGTLKLAGTANTYTGGTIVEQGSTLDLTTANVSTGNANIVNAGGLIVFDQATSGTYSGVISDGCQMQLTCTTKLSGSLVKDDSTGNNTGNVTLGAVQAYTGGTFVEAGTLTLGIADAVASSSGVDLGRVGGGAAATLVLAADNTIRGLMSEKGNTTTVQLNGKTLTVDTASNQAWNFDGSIAGAGGFVKKGAGTQILSGTSAYTGETTVNAGLLRVDGSIASSSLTTVNTGAVLGGNGTIGNALINGGTLWRANSPTPFTVQGNLAFTAGSTYLAEVSPVSAGLTNVTGTASLAGTVNAYFAPGSYIEKRYAILSASGISGKFDTLANTNLPGGFSSSLSYASGKVSLDLAYTLASTAGLNANQKNVANALTSYFNANGIPMVFGALSPAGLTQAAGESAASTQSATYSAMTQFMGVMGDPFVEGRSGAVVPDQAMSYAADGDGSEAFAYASPRRQSAGRDAFAAINKAAPRQADSFAQRWSIWGAGYGGSQTTDGNAAAGSSTVTSRIYGMAVGADYRLSPDTLVGFALAGGGTNFSVANSGRGRSDLFQAGAFARHSMGSAYISTALAYGWQDVTTDRTVTIAGSDQLRAKFNVNAFSGRIESGYRFGDPRTAMAFTPYVAGQFTVFNLPGYAEQTISGNNTFALSYAAKDITTWRSELGLRADKSFALQDAILTLRGRAAWAHDYNTDRSIAATFQTLPGASFVVNGAAPGHDAALLTAGAEVKWRNGFSLAGTFEGEFSNTTQSYSGRGVFRYAW